MGCRVVKLPPMLLMTGKFCDWVEVSPAGGRKDQGSPKKEE